MEKNQEILIDLGVVESRCRCRSRRNWKAKRRVATTIISILACLLLVTIMRIHMAEPRSAKRQSGVQILSSI